MHSIPEILIELMKKDRVRVDNEETVSSDEMTAINIMLSVNERCEKLKAQKIQKEKYLPKKIQETS
jgi:hypothetical protein